MSFRLGAIVGLMLISAAVFAQREDFNVRDPKLNEGSLFTIKFTPAAKRVDVSVAGKPAALLGPDQVEVFGRELNSGKTKKLTIKPVEDHFEIMDHLNSAAPVEFDVHDKTNKKKETFKFNTKERP